MRQPIIPPNATMVTTTCQIVIIVKFRIANLVVRVRAEVKIEIHLFEEFFVVPERRTALDEQRIFLGTLFVDDICVGDYGQIVTFFQLKIIMVAHTGFGIRFIL